MQLSLPAEYSAVGAVRRRHRFVDHWLPGRPAPAAQASPAPDDLGMRVARQPR